jgi:acyl-CoA reductase-like NAD-dependent aldehyde dehydrogenase
MEDYRTYIGGEWAEATSGETFDNCDPYSGEGFARVAACDATDTTRAIEAAQRAQSIWASAAPAQRRDTLLRAADILERQRDSVAAALTQETGATFGFAMFQCAYTPGLLREAAAQTHRAVGEILPSDTPGAFYFTQRRPAGVVAGISPWNAPLILSLRAIAVPLALGNTVVLKPAPDSPYTGGLLLARMLEEAGLPPGVLNVVTHAPAATDAVGDALIEHPAVKRLSFTGSTSVGRRLAEKCGRHLKRIALELGGHNPLLILGDADLAHAVDVAAFGAFLHQGQICMSVRRILVAREVAAEFTERLVAKAKSLGVGDPRERSTIVGPLINDRQLAHVRDNVAESVAAGATVLCGADHQGRCYRPTVLRGVPVGSKVACEETFGPVVSIAECDSDEQALEIANTTSYGLSAAVLTRDYERGLWFADRLESGMVHINDSTVLDEPHVPFGGVKGSGLGRLGGSGAIEEFTEQRWITIQRQPRRYPF